MSLARITESIGAILLLEDDDSVAGMLAEAIKAIGLDCHRAASVAEAECIASQAEAAGVEFNAVICDQHLSDGKGTDFARRLRDNGWGGRIVLISADASLPASGDLENFGIDLRLSKGLPVSGLIATLTFLLKPGNERSVPPGPSLPGHLINDYKARLCKDHADLTRFDPCIQREEITALAHRLRGSAGLFGFDELRCAAGRCEAVGRSSEALDFSREVSNLIEVLVRASN